MSGSTSPRPRACVVLPCEPASASAARRFAARTLHEWGEEAIDDVVELLLSEVVTNALLHAASPVEVCLARQSEGVRVAVADQSPAMPSQRDWADDASTGRGLSLIEALSSGWGVEHADGGKVVWFTVGGDTTQPRDPLAAFDLDEFDDEAVARAVVELRGAPVLLFPAMHRHLDALMREWALVGTAEDDWQPAHLGVDLSPATRALAAAGDSGHSTADAAITVTSPAEARENLAAVREMVRQADQLANDGALLTPPALPEIGACIEWFFDQLINQLDGAPAVTWHAPAVVGEGRSVQFNAGAVLDNLAAAAVVADEANHIVYANAAAEQLLGWGRGQLAGQRLTAIIPERLRDAHIAGYSRFQLTREARLIGSAVQVPALRRDGSEVEVSLELSVTGDASAPFVASMRAIEQHSSSGAVAANQTLHALAHAERSTAHEVLGALATAAQWQAACWWTVDAGQLTCTACWTQQEGAYAAFIEATHATKFSEGAGLPGRVWKSGQVAWIPDVVADSNFPRSGAAAAAGLRSACGLPVGAGVTQGVVELFGSEVRSPDDELTAAYAVAGPLLGSLSLA